MTSAVDTFAKYYGTLESSITHAFAVTTDDANDLPYVTREIFVGVSGDLKVTLLGMADNTFVVYKNVQGGMSYAWRVKRVWQAGTTASNIVGNY